MFHLILTACLASGSGDCRPILLPQGDGATRNECLIEAERITSDWIAQRPDLTAKQSECLENSKVRALNLQTIAPDIWFRQGQIAQLENSDRGRIANLSVIIGGDSVAVIDAGATRQEGQELYAAIRGLTDKPISHLILTHMHPDHVLGASVFAEAGTQIVASDRLPAALDARAETYLENMRRILGPAEMIGTEVVMPDMTVTDRSRIELGGRRLILQTVPTAHTDNDLMVRDVATNTLLAGDLIFRGLTPVVDGSINGWLGWMGTTPADVALIVPGHGAPATGWGQAVSEQQSLLARLRKLVREAIAADKSISETVPEIVETLQPDAGTWVAFPETIARNATAAYKELEWE